MRSRRTSRFDTRLPPPPPNQTILDVSSLPLSHTAKQILKRRLNWNRSRTDSRAIVRSLGLQPCEEPGVTSRAVAAERPGQVFAAGALSRVCRRPWALQQSRASRPLRSAACSKAVCLRGSLGSPFIFLKGSRPACSPKLLLCRVERAPAQRTVT